MPSWILFALLAALFASLVSLFGKVGLQHIDSTLATTIRSVIMAGFLIITSFTFGKFETIKDIDRKTLFFIALSGIAGATSWLFYFLSLKMGPAGAVAALDKLSIVFVVVLAGLFLGEGLTWKLVIGSFLVAGGAVLIAFK